MPDRDSVQMRLILSGQLLATAAILAWIPDNFAKLAAMAAIWGLCFRCVTGRELIMMAAVNVIFISMNLAALHRGIFAFNHPDFLGMPVYECLMWGFYTLHVIRFLDGPSPHSPIILAAAAAAAFALPFATIAEPLLLLLISAAVLAAAIALFHEKMDLAYAAYMAAIGALIEHVGVATGQWHYPGQPWGDVPPWFLTMWAGVGLFTRRLVLPLLSTRAPVGLAPPRPGRG